MEKFKEFQGRDLDECINQAMSWFDCPRDALEVDILQDAKTGIFGIVGARKARIRARRAHLRETARNLLASGRAEMKDAPEDGESKPGGPGREAASAKSDAEPAALLEKADERYSGLDLEEALEEEEETPPLENIDKEKLERLAREVVGNLARPIAGRDVDMQVDVSQGKPRCRIDWQGDAGLLIGREGQTLIAMQYLASRILSSKMGAAIRVQLDIGEYRSRQDDKLREMAKTLAERARKTGKPCATRPLSSYHRRIIHLHLQNEADVQTRSSGEGALKRVVISPRRS